MAKQPIRIKTAQVTSSLSHPTSMTTNPSADDESDRFAAECLVELRRVSHEQDVSDEESVTNVLLAMSDRAKRAHRNREKSLRSTYDLAESKGFLQLQSTGKYKVRLEGDNESDEGDTASPLQKRTADSSSVIVHKA